MSQIDAGDPTAAEQLLPLVYDELRKLAAAKLVHEKPGQTLQATALDHEAFLSLWVVNDSSTDKVFKYNLSGSMLGSCTVTGAATTPTGITLDPTSVNHLWIVDNGTDRVYQFDNAVGRTSGSQSPSTSFVLAVGNTNPQGIADPPVVGGSGAESASDAALLAFLGDVESSLIVRKRRR